jgi:nucleosome assembly protein 1-like 1
VPTESFFNFFDPPKPPQDDDDATSDIEERLELDYQLGEDIKEKLIPRAIDWFTGEALQYENIEDFDEGEFEDEDDEDEDELSDDRDEEEESDDEVSSPSHSTEYSHLTQYQNDGTKPKQEAAECKQS